MPKRKYQKEADQPISKDAWPKRELFLFEPKTLLIIIITSVLTLLIVFLGEKGVKFMTSVISPIPAHAPFDGTVFPVKQMPNWVKLTEAERKGPYNAIPPEKMVPIAFYNPSKLVIPNSTLKWNNAQDDAIRNEKITYSVPYLGTYRLDGIEGAGSHPGIDIKIPEGTPIYAIANGTVIKSQYTNGGFGNHIVIQHNDFPSLEDKNKMTTVYSAYAHLSSISVNVNDVVAKGQLIGFSGSSGTATTPHLHFQIDNDSAPWHPYWHFTSAEQRSAGYSFFDAINNGFKKENAAANTLNPMRYVQAYLGDQVLVASAVPEATKALSELADQYNNLTFVLQVLGGAQFEEGSEVKIMIQAFDENGNLISNPSFEDAAKISLLNNVGKLNVESLVALQFKTGIYGLLKVENARIGKDKVLLRFRDKEFSSPEFEVIAKKSKVVAFVITPLKTEAEIDENVNVMLKAVDASGNVVTDLFFDENPFVGLTNGIGELSVNSLFASNFSAGESAVTLHVKTAGTAEIFMNYKGQTFRSSAIKVNEPLPPPSPPLPPPPPPSAPEPELQVVAEPVAENAGTTTEPTETARPAPSLEVTEIGTSSEPAPAENIAQPVPEPAAGTTTPSAAETPVQPATEPQAPAVPLPFSDVQADSQYFQALTELKSAGLVAGYADGTFKPDKEVSRAESVTFILRALNEQIKEIFKLEFPDVNQSEWYFKFVATAFELGFVKGYPDGYFRPNDTVSLAEFLTMLFVGAKTDIDPQVTGSLPEGVLATDWFAPYVQEALKQKIIEAKDNKLEPAKPMTRGAIAEILYRLKQAEKESAGR